MAMAIRENQFVGQMLSEFRSLVREYLGQFDGERRIDSSCQSLCDALHANRSTIVRCTESLIYFATGVHRLTASDVHQFERMVCEGWDRRYDGTYYPPYEV